MAVGGVEPAVAVELGEDGLADGAGIDEAFGFHDLGVAAAVVGDGADEMGMFRGGLRHLLGRGVVHGGGLFAEDVFAGLEGGEEGGVMEGDGGGDVDGVDGGVSQGIGEVGVAGDAVGLRLGGLGGDDGVEAGAGFGEDGGEDSAGGDIANARD